MNKTLEQILTSLEDVILNKNDYFNSFGYGSIINLVSKTDIKYPMLWIDNLLQVNTYKNGVFIFKFDLLIMDLVYDDDSNEKYILSDTLRAGIDLINHLKDNFNTYGFFVNKRQGDSIDFVNFNEKFVDRVSGTKITIELMVPDDGNVCKNIFTI